MKLIQLIEADGHKELRTSGMKLQQYVLDMDEQLGKHVTLTSKLKQVNINGDDALSITITDKNGLLHCELIIKRLLHDDHYILSVYDRKFGLLSSGSLDTTDEDSILKHALRRVIKNGLLYTSYVTDFNTQLAAQPNISSSNDAWLGPDDLYYLIYKPPFRLPTGNGSWVMVRSEKPLWEIGAVTLTATLNDDGIVIDAREPIHGKSVHDVLVKLYQAVGKSLKVQAKWEKHEAS